MSSNADAEAAEIILYDIHDTLSMGQIYSSASVKPMQMRMPNLYLLVIQPVSRKMKLQ